MRIWILLGFWLVGGMALVRAQALPVVSCGKIVRLENVHSKYVADRNVDVWLPEGYDGKKRFPVLYMHDGQMLFDSNMTWNHQAWEVDETICRMAANQQIRACIVVGICNGGGSARTAEYMPEKALEHLNSAGKKLLFPNDAEKPLADNYLKFLVNELKPMVDKQFSTLPNPKNTFVSGSSKGGLISLYAICEYPKVFGGAACLSTHWPGIYTNENNPIPDAILKYMEASLPEPKKHLLYFDHGTASLDSLYTVWQEKADLILKKKGFGPKNWTTQVFPGENHSEIAWSNRFHVPLKFLLGVKQ